MNNRIGTDLSDFSLTAYDVTGHHYINEIHWAGYGEAPYKYIREINNPCQVIASYKLWFYDRFFPPVYPIIHSVKREIKFWIVPDDLKTAKKVITKIRQNLKQEKNPYDDILVINIKGHQMFPKYTNKLPKKIYDFFNNIYGYKQQNYER